MVGLALFQWSGPAWGASTAVVLLQRGGGLVESHCAGGLLNGGMGSAATRPSNGGTGSGRGQALASGRKLAAI